MKVIDLAQVPKTRVQMEGAAGAYKQIPISAADGSPTFSVRVFTIEPHGHTPYHRHPFEHLNYVISGKGHLVDESGKKHPLKPGDFILVLPNEMHQYRNASESEPLIVICAVPREYE